MFLSYQTKFLCSLSKAKLLINFKKNYVPMCLKLKISGNPLHLSNLCSNHIKTKFLCSLSKAKLLNNFKKNYVPMCLKLKISGNPLHLSNPCSYQKPTNHLKDCFTNSQSLSLPKFSYKWLHSNNLIFQFRYKKL